MSITKDITRHGAVMAFLPPASEGLSRRKTRIGHWHSDIKISTSDAANITELPTYEPVKMELVRFVRSAPDCTIRHIPLRFAIAAAPQGVHRDNFVKRFASACESRGLNVFCFALPHVRNRSCLTGLDDAIRDMEKYRRLIITAMKTGSTLQVAVDGALSDGKVAITSRGATRTSNLRLCHVSQKDQLSELPLSSISGGDTRIGKPRSGPTKSTTQDAMPLKPSQRCFRTTASGYLEGQIRLRICQLQDLQKAIAQQDSVVLGATQARPEQQVSANAKHSDQHSAAQQSEELQLKVQEKTETILALRKRLDASALKAQAQENRIETLESDAVSDSKGQQESMQERDQRIQNLVENVRHRDETITTLREQLTDTPSQLSVTSTRIESLEQELRTTLTRYSEQEKRVLELQGDNQQLKNSLLEKYIHLERCREKMEELDGRGSKRGADTAIREGSAKRQQV